MIELGTMATMAGYGAIVAGLLTPKKLLFRWCWWALSNAVWRPLRAGFMTSYEKATDPSRGFVHKHMFGRIPRHWYGFGGTRHGKSSQLKELLAEVIPDCLAGKKSLFLMDSSELIDELLAKARFTDEELRERVILIDLAKPGGDGDIGCLPRLNLMETSAGQERDGLVELSARINVFKMVFEGLIGGKLTDQMETMVGFAAQTMVHVDNPTIETLLELLRDPIAFIRTIDRLPPKVRAYWRDAIKIKLVEGAEVGEDNTTARGIANRIHSMTADPVIERLLSNPVPTVNLAERLNEGAIILVATRKGEIMSEGTRVIGRFMLSMLLRAMNARNSLAGPISTLIAVDEFQDYLRSGADESFLQLLSQVAKKNGRMALIHQEWGQVSQAMCSSVLTNCEIKTCGGMTESIAAQMRPLLGIRAVKGKGWAIDLVGLPRFHFAAGVKGMETIIIKSKADPLGDAFHRLPSGKRGVAVVRRELDRAREMMRDLYAHCGPSSPPIEPGADMPFAEPELI